MRPAGFDRGAKEVKRHRTFGLAPTTAGAETCLQLLPAAEHPFDPLLRHLEFLHRPRGLFQELGREVGNLILTILIPEPGCASAEIPLQARIARLTEVDPDRAHDHLIEEPLLVRVVRLEPLTPEFLTFDDGGRNIVGQEDPLPGKPVLQRIPARGGLALDGRRACAFLGVCAVGLDLTHTRHRTNSSSGCETGRGQDSVKYHRELGPIRSRVLPDKAKIIPIEAQNVCERERSRSRDTPIADCLIPGFRPSWLAIGWLGMTGRATVLTSPSTRSRGRPITKIQ